MAEEPINFDAIAAAILRPNGFGRSNNVDSTGGSSSSANVSLLYSTILWTFQNSKI
jgi:hypothetical protein